MPNPEPLEVVFYKSDAGRMPLREWLKGLPPEDRKIIGENIKAVQFGWPVGMPVVRPIANVKRLWEIRSTLTSGVRARIFFTVWRGFIVLLHGFVKKTAKTPKKEIDTAKRRMRKFYEVEK